MNGAGGYRTDFQTTTKTNIYPTHPRLSIPLFLAPSALLSPKKKPGKLNVKHCFHHGPIRPRQKITSNRSNAHPSLPRPSTPTHSTSLAIHTCFSARLVFFFNPLLFPSAHVSQASSTCSQPCRAAAVGISVTRAAPIQPSPAQPTPPTPAPHRTAPSPAFPRLHKP
jgi:hypothetical protein